VTVAAQTPNQALRLTRTVCKLSRIRAGSADAAGPLERLENLPETNMPNPLPLYALTACLLAAPAASPEPARRPPNVIIIFIDDLGYADIGPFGAKGYSTPNLDRMAAEGIKFTHFYAAQAVCSASRAALMTGCYPNRVGIPGALGPKSKIGISDKEMTIAELCKQKGYATGIFGKWHLGDAPQFLPTRHGFDEWFGLPYSNDMWPRHPEMPKSFPPLPLFENEKVLDADVDDAAQDMLTTWYTERAVRFIERNRERPFLLYLPHTMVHVPLHVSDRFRGKTKRGLFGDAVEELDWSVGEVLAAIRRNGLDEDTLVIFSSDNGPWLSYGDHAGSAGPLREGKGTSWDGGVREPTLMRWPGRIPPGKSCDAPLMTIDVFPTVARLIGAKLPDHAIDGLDISDQMFGRSAESPHKALFFWYNANDLEAMRSGKWKLEFARSYRSLDGRPGGTGGTPAKYSRLRIAKPQLYDLEADPGQTRDVSDANPDVMKTLLALAEEARSDLGDDLSGRKGTGRREPGRVPSGAK
jgi:arylsulfatase A-like enzyme